MRKALTFIFRAYSQYGDLLKLPCLIPQHAESVDHKIARLYNFHLRALTLSLQDISRTRPPSMNGKVSLSISESQ